MVTPKSATSGHYDAVIVGSGFGGSVAALRLTEKGYNVAVLESGERFDNPNEADPQKRHQRLPTTSWRLRKYLWAPKLGLRGIQRIHLLRGKKGSRVLILAGAGVGGGSLVYANTLYRPSGRFYHDPQWGDITDWESELAPYYDQAERMLGVVTNPLNTPADDVMRTVATNLGVEDTFRPTEVGVLFGGNRDVPDPYFGGAGPTRSPCIACGACMTGCRYGSKNMLTENYLYLAERSGADIHPLTTVTGLKQHDDGTWDISTRRTDGLRTKRHVTADHVILAAGTWGTQKLLHRMKHKHLPQLSPRLGELTRTNSEAILGAERFSTKGDDHSKGIAITSSFFPDHETHVEPVRYGAGSNSMSLLRTLLIDGYDGTTTSRVPRWLRFIGKVLRRPWLLVHLFTFRKWSQRTIIALVMQQRDNSLNVQYKRGGLRATVGHGEPNPVWLPIGHKVTREMAAETNSLAGGTWLDVVNTPTTAHFLGGCPIGNHPDNGVVDPYHRAFGYTGLHVLDGSTVSANPGVNPSLTITAQAERALAMWPNKGDEDQRPALGETYRPVSPVMPRNAIVPAEAPAALRLPIRPVSGGHTSPDE